VEIAGKTLCFLGPFPSEPDPVKFELLQLGGRFTDDLKAASIDAVVVADATGTHAEAARKRGLRVVPLHELVEYLVTVAPAGRVANLRRTLRAKVGPTSPGELADALHEADPGDVAALSELVRNAHENDVNVELSEGEPAASAPDDAWLLAWCSDADGCSFYAVPSEEAERAALRTIRGSCFADGSDVHGARLGVLIRVLAGMEFVGNREPADLARRMFEGWHAEFAGSEDEVGLASADDLMAWIGWLRPHLLTTFSQLGRPYAVVVAVNQAM
jgi:hypothetical protein